ncbi:MAG: hypothetical protein KBT46_00940 [Ruminococcus sp.]|nr:hypothetical protein [Candidatus Copronaster equi]
MKIKNNTLTALTRLIKMKMNEPIFKFPDKYGRIANLKNQQVAQERNDYSKENNLYLPLSDDEHLRFEIYLSKKYKKQLKSYCLEYGTVENALLTFCAGNTTSNLLQFLYNERNCKNEKTSSA